MVATEARGATGAVNVGTWMSAMTSLLLWPAMWSRKKGRSKIPEDEKEVNMSKDSNSEDPGEWVKEVTKCPICGSTWRLMETITQQLIAEGKAAPGTKAFVEVGLHGYLDPTKPLIVGQLLPAGRVGYDICECGFKYAVAMRRTKIDSRMITGQPQMPMIKPQQGPPPGFGPIRGS